MQCDKIGGIKMTLETQAMNLESAAHSAEAFQAMAAGNDTMKKIRHQVGVEQVDDVMDDLNEEMQLAQEISTAMGQPIDPAMGTIDDDELWAELEEMEKDDLNAQFDQAALGNNNASSAGNMPSVPNSKLSSSIKNLGLPNSEAEELSRLQAELAM